MRAPLWWHEVEAGRFALGLVALLAAGTAAATAAVPPKAARADQWSTTNAATAAGWADRDIIISGTPRISFDKSAPLTDDDVAQRTRSFVPALPPALAKLVTEVDATASDAQNRFVDAASLPSGSQRVYAKLSVVPTFAERVRFVAGAAPTAAQTTTTHDPTTGRTTDRIGIAISQEASKNLGLPLGTTFTQTIALPAVTNGQAAATVVEYSVTGVYVTATALGDADPIWHYVPQALHPVLMPTCPDGGGGSAACDLPPSAWHIDLLTSQTFATVLVADAAGGRPRVAWDAEVDPARLRYADLGAVDAAVHGIQKNSGALKAFEGGTLAVSFDTGLQDIATEVRTVTWSSHVVDAVVLGGATAGALAALVLVLSLAIARRSREIALVKARGAGPLRLSARIALEISLVALAGGAAGATGSTALTDGSFTDPVQWSGAIGAFAVCFAVAGRKVWKHTDQVVSQRRESLSNDARTRRVVRDVTVVLAAVGALGIYHASGSGSTVGRIDWLSVAAPALLAFAAATVAVRLAPALIHPAARISSRRRGAVGFVGATLAGRRIRSVAAPLTGLVVVVAAGMFAAGYDASVAAKVRANAIAAVGADVRVVAGVDTTQDVSSQVGSVQLDKDFRTRAATLPGVTHAATGWSGSAFVGFGADSSSVSTGTTPPVAILIVDAEEFRTLEKSLAVTEQYGVDPLPSSWPASAPPKTASALLSPGLAAGVGKSGLAQIVSVYDIKLQGAAAVNIPAAAAAATEFGFKEYIVVARDQVQAAVDRPGTPVAELTGPNTAWLDGNPTSAAIAKLPGVNSNYLITRHDTLLSQGFADGQVASARDVFHLVEALCAGYFALCLLLLLAATGGVSRDSALLMQVFGLRSGLSRLIMVLVPLPIAVLAVAAGVGMGLGLSPLLGPLTQSGSANGAASSAAAPTSGTVLSTSSIGFAWAIPVVGAVLVLTAIGIVLDLLVRRQAELSVRLRTAEYE